MSFFSRKSKKQKVLEKKDVEAIVQQEQAHYIKREELQEYLSKTNADERKKKLWDSLSPHRKLKLLRFMATKKGVKDGKK